ncbi:hypothetical protein Poli38472_003923 [Pythium oligandrum]|uniref:3-dehydroquinate dehydratase n=1 Tax=Pythium oligandrum TaxID=41045 RepID=A0A8K1CPS2_PYTOL|nr:hypothetical protein Poli38472_003923 [Pythium oligandrum]|eukprot:TMW66158.1 hypothetical protein Poli38472_003923 [Pythium oligandrum]
MQATKMQVVKWSLRVHKPSLRWTNTRTDGRIATRLLSTSDGSNDGRSGRVRNARSSNPFEIQFDYESAPSGNTHRDAKPTGTFKDEIDLFHEEMSSVFGETPEEFNDDDNQEPASAFHPEQVLSNETPDLGGPRSLAFENLSQPNPTRLERSVTSSHVKVQSPPRHVDTAYSDVLFIQGPCTFVHGAWTGAQDQIVLREVQETIKRLGADEGMVISTHHSNHEGEILELLLAARPGSKIILNWNGRLADSPTIFRGLSIIDASVVVIVPRDVDVGALPLSVKGVLTGFDARVLDLAIQALR